MIKNYDDAVKIIKTTIFQYQYDAVKTINEKQLALYFAIGKYISQNTRNGNWGDGAIESISNLLEKEMPGLRGFSPRNIRDMRTFYEEWSFLEFIPNSVLAPVGAKLSKNQINMPSECSNISINNFLSIGFTLHRTVLAKTKTLEERIFYINRAVEQKYTRNQLSESIDRDDYHHQGNLPNNFRSTMSTRSQSLKAIRTFKDEYLLNFINTEELDVRDKEDVDEKILENEIIHNIKKFILTFGRDFAFVGNQHHLNAFGVDQYIDLLFFNRELNCLVAIELKSGEFKTSYLGQLSGYLSILNKFERKKHENPPIGIILCKDMDRSFVDFVIQDFSKPMGVATYKDLSEKVKKCLPNIDDLKKIIERKDNNDETTRH